MSIRTYLDQSFFHDVHEWRGSHPKDVIVRAFTSHRYSLYVSGESVSEMFALLGTDRADRLPLQAQLLLEIMSGRVLRYYGDLILSEVTGQAISEFLPSGQERQLREILATLARGEIPESIPEVILETRQRKDTDLQVWREARQSFQERLEQGGVDRTGSPPPFDEFCARHLGELFQEFITEGKGRGRLPNIAITTEQLVNFPERYPYANAAFRTWVALTYRHWIKNRAVERGDIFDLQQVASLAKLDLLVTSDSGMRELCSLVYGGRVRVLTRGDFIDELVGWESVCVK